VATAKPEARKLFAPAVKNVTIEIAYAASAAPYAGSLKKFGDIWNVFHVNALAIFDGKKTVTHPRALAGMAKLDDVPSKSFTTGELLEIASSHRTSASSEDTAAFYVLFVDGYWIDDAGVEQKDVLGRSIGASGVVVVFKPAVAAVAGASPELVEQLTLVHYFGHAVGFVDNGVPVAENNRRHVDADGHHCTNKQCAMSADVETSAGAATFASTLIRSPEGVILGQDCLSDARIFENAAP